MKTAIIGQRYIWKSSNNSFVCQITSVGPTNGTGPQRIGWTICQILSGDLFKVGRAYPAEYLEEHLYTLLEGQDAP